MKSIKFILCFLILSLEGCNSLNNKLLPTYNNGGYVINKANSKTLSKSLIISGKVFDKDTREPLANAQINIGCHKLVTSKSGEFSYNTTNSAEKIFIETIFIGYKSIVTDYIKTANINKVQIDFYLVQDDRPLEDCLGTIINNK